MRSVGKGGLGLGIAVGALAISFATASAGAMPKVPTGARPGSVVPVQFLGGPFFGPHGYYHKNPADRHYFYEGFDPSVYPPVKRWRTHRRYVHHLTYRKHRR